jgi:hypothetical protein
MPYAVFALTHSRRCRPGYHQRPSQGALERFTALLLLFLFEEVVPTALLLLQTHSRCHRLSPPTPSSRSTSTFEITLRTWQHASGVSERAFSVERIRANSGHKELWMLSPVDEPVGDTRVPAPGTSDSGWTVEKMREVTGAYTEDLERSSQPFWRTVDRTQAIAQQKGRYVEGCDRGAC